VEAPSLGAPPERGDDTPSIPDSGDPSQKSRSIRALDRRSTPESPWTARGSVLTRCCSYGDPSALELCDEPIRDGKRCRVNDWRPIERGRADILAQRTEDLGVHVEDLEVEVEVPLSVAPPPGWRSAFSALARPPLLPSHLSPPTVTGAVVTFMTPRASVGDYLIALDGLIERTNHEFQREYGARPEDG
jgi:hypothetical protein